MKWVLEHELAMFLCEGFKEELKGRKSLLGKQCE
jgi:hypothetical protein